MKLASIQILDEIEETYNHFECKICSQLFRDDLLKDSFLVEVMNY